MFPPFTFSIQEFFIFYFYFQKTAFVCEFQHTSLWKLMNFSRFHTSCRHEIFVDMYLTHLGIRIGRGTFHIYLRKWFLGTPKDCCPPLTGAKKKFSSTLNIIILQIVRNESVRFGRQIDIEVSYKILWLEIPKLVQTLYYLACFQKGLFGGNIE
jgi:hypothetical protein